MHTVYYEIVFAVDDAGINRPYINGKLYSGPPANTPMLYDLLQTSRLRVKPAGTGVEIATALLLPKKAWSPFMEVEQYHLSSLTMLSLNSLSTILVHTHGHTVWVVAMKLFMMATT